MIETTSIDYDVIVIGAGAGGAASAWRYATLGYSVCIIERGDWQNPAHYPSNFVDWEERRHRQYSYNPNIRNNEADYQVDNSDSPISVANFNGVGGSTILYSGHFPRFHESDFKTKTLDGVGQDWPIDYVTLRSYYELNEGMMRVAGLVGDPAYPSMVSTSLRKPVPIGAYGEKLGTAFNDLGWHWWPSYSAISTTSAGGNPACQNIGPCNTGCPTGAKSSVDVTYIPSALALGATLKTNTVALQLLHKGGRVNGVTVHGPDGKQDLRSRITVLACNAVGTARFLLHFKKTASSQISNNLSDQLGKNLMLHPLGYAQANLPIPTDVESGPQGCCIYSHEFYETDTSRGYSRGYTMHILRGPMGLDGVTQSIDAGDIRYGQTFLEDVESVRGRRASIAIICEDLPKLDNEVYLKDELDSDGMPVVGIRYEVDENTKKMMIHGLNSARTVLRKAGARRVRAMGPVSDAGWHLMGTARMGYDRKDSVTSPIGEVHGLSGLFVADGSLMVTSAGVNPAHTIQALALYVATKSSEKYLNYQGHSL